MSLWASFVSGIFATVMMDLIALSFLRKQVFDLNGLQIVPALLGRWMFNLKKCNLLSRNDIRTFPPVAQESMFGMGVHYLIGAGFGAVFLFAVLNLDLQTHEIFLGGLLYGLLTNLCPWLVMYPSMGFGFFGKRLSIWRELVKFSLLNHLVYGLFLGLSFIAFKEFVVL